jgi:hypothetical protein
MAEWTGETGETSTEGERFVRKYVTRLVSQGGCKPDVALKVVRDLLTELANGISSLTDEE